MNWPDDRFTLVKPWYGCPPGWAQGWTYQDNEDMSNNNYITYYHHFYGRILDGFIFKSIKFSSQATRSINSDWMHLRIGQRDICSFFFYHILTMLKIQVRRRPEVTADVEICDGHCGQRLSIIAKHFKVLSLILI